MAVQPLRNERRPLKPLQPWTQPANTTKYKVRTGETWFTLAARNHHQYSEHDIIWINFRLSPLDRFYTDQVNWYLREYVGCRHSLDGGRNWAFTDDADPGYIFLPDPMYYQDAIAITGTKGVGVISAPGYSDQNAYDVISKALDVYGIADMGISMSEIPLGALAEGGMIAVGTLATLVGPFVALGAPYNDALQYKSRRHFFGAFCSSFVMQADGWSSATVSDFYPPLAYPPLDNVFPEKRETFRKLHNFGLRLGRLQGSRLNTVDKKSLFLLLRGRLSDADSRYWNGDAKEWSVRKKKDYYDLLGAILLKLMLENDLMIKLR
ncbi:MULTISPECIES: hypothetical protein [unclassified Bradyrhizobium]|uniref:hypothetical protein n=1 Tax=unclassified Bradyrhizobium TaxID=2631580 RepID=UPI0015C8DD66|nr:MULTISPECIES: hypothetical protein [unclassified Bradyrhizobium]MBB4256134.1 hypothetical protein [Bradyrhizobium sp. CIR3A]NYG48303.1 hypothetical protein [Bradyrhizobium sp. IAR9]